ncbi:hypothetical protein NKH23_33825 [Mesorhizobium sp. M1328]|uniref:hypothetical protein n=1 Tax=Mesorhizobium sp. M1328 TaxID=2957082 RepID=UPI00333777D7
MTDQRLGLGLDNPAVLARSILLHGKHRVVAALPVYHQLKLFVFDTHDDLAQYGTKDALAAGCHGGGMVPSRLKISTHAQQPLAFIFR